MRVGCGGGSDEAAAIAASTPGSYFSASLGSGAGEPSSLICKGEQN